MPYDIVEERSGPETLRIAKPCLDRCTPAQRLKSRPQLKLTSVNTGKAAGVAMRLFDETQPGPMEL